MGDNSFAPGYPRPGYSTFVVQNITNPPKMVRIFNWPISPPGNDGDTRDYMKVPGVAESDIRASLLKGELKHKLLAGEIVILASDIDLLQFNDLQATFLYQSGVATGIQIGIPQQAFVWSQDIPLVGVVDGVNTTFTIPNGTFIQSGYYKIVVYLNGVKQNPNDDYTIFASDGGSLYDTVIFAVPPESSVLPSDVVTADFWQSNE